MDRFEKFVLYWLFIGLVFIFFQIILGGITRLTGSGLSITRWEIVTGILYPISSSSWDHYFNLYKETPQYLKINQGMTLDEFKFIFFWEYLHRFWARAMGLVFIFPFLFFIVKKKLNKNLIFRLIVVLVLAIFVASLGWIMVASGLVNRPWVNAFKLSFHLTSAILLLSFLFWTFLLYWKKNYLKRVPSSNYSLLFLVCFVFLQLFIGGVMSGMKAGLVAPTWPLINSLFVPLEMYSIKEWPAMFLNRYELNSSSAIIVQFLHRIVAYSIGFICLSLWIAEMKRRRMFDFTSSYFGLVCIVLVQIVIGVFTLLNCVGKIPVGLGSAHQIVGIGFYCYCLYLYFQTTYVEKINRGE
jgi:heme a synthase